MNRRTTIKLSISGSILLYTVVSGFLFGGRVAIPVAVGMLFGFVGDACLARVPAVTKHFKDPFILGVASFMMGHLFYVLAFHLARIRYDWRFLCVLAAYGAVSAAIWLLSMRKEKGTPALLRFGSLAYALVIGVMASFAAALWIARGGFFWIPALGGLLFVISDSFIAFGEFGGVNIPHKEALIWATYAPAQFCIALLPMLLSAA